MKVLFLLNDGFGIGGTITTTFNLAGALADRGHDVEVLSTVRRRDAPQMPLHPAVRLLSLVETREENPDYLAGHPLRGKPARFYPAADFRSGDYDRLIEDRYERFLAGSDADVVIATRAGLIAYAGRFAPASMIKIGQEHLTRLQQRPAMRDELPGHLRRLDAFVTITARDAEDYRQHVRLGRTELTFIPNSVPVPGVPPSDGAAKIVVAAGRLVISKRYDVLIRGFARVVAERPDWQLRIYGQGKLNGDLRSLVRELGLHNHVLMMGPYTPIETEWAKGAVAAVPSDREPFGMTLVEAMRCGVPVISTDAPYGPAEILDDGADGLLTPVGDADAMGAALLRVINDDELRRDMAVAALKNSERYDPSLIAVQYEELFERLAAAKRRTWPWSRRRRAPGPVLGPAPSATDLTTVNASIAADGTLELEGVLDLTGFVWRRPGVEVPLGGPLAEGDWELTTRDGTPVRAGSLDTRHARGTVLFRHADGSLRLRYRDRPVYAEVAEVRVDDAGIRVTGTLTGGALGGGTLAGGTLGGGTLAEPVLEARSAETVELPATRTPEGFEFLIPALADGTWSLWLRHAPGAPPVRVGRHLDDVVRKDVAYVFPAAEVDGATVQPLYDGNNNLGVRVSR